MKILFISYFYPPLGGPAALRNQKTVKYLSSAGCRIDVISVGEIEYNYYDSSLMDGAGEHSVIRTASYDPMALLKMLFGKSSTVSRGLYHNTPEKLKLFIRRLYPLDDKIGWLPPLLKAGTTAMRQNNYQLIYVSCGPFSSAVAAWWLSRKFKVPYVLEMRDYWTLLSDYNLQGSYLNRMLSRAWELRLLKAASGIVTATKGIADDLCAAFGANLKEKSFTLYNGPDEEDYQNLKPMLAHEGFVLSYFGALYARRSLKNLYAAMRELASEGALPQGTQIRLYGNFHREALQEIESSGISQMITLVPQLQHQAALQEMQNADALILLINSSSPRGTLTSKVFEYLRLGKPVLAMIPHNGEAAGLLNESGQDYICAMESTSGIKACIKRLSEDFKQKREFGYPKEKYSRKTQVLELLEFLKLR